MSEYGFIKGEYVKIYYNKQCEPGDACAFECLIDRCTQDGETNWLKRLVRVENGCYWFEGNKEPWIENGVRVRSFDSRSYGCLSRNDFYIYGVAEPLNRDL